jgi:hypothetical protein
MYVCLNNWNENLFESSKSLECAIILQSKVGNVPKDWV